MPRREAMNRSLASAFKSILVSALTLSTAGFTLYMTSSNRYVADIGLLLDGNPYFPGDGSAFPPNPAYCI